jgi:hypothetical protein
MMYENTILQLLYKPGLQANRTDPTDSTDLTDRNKGGYQF